MAKRKAMMAKRSWRLLRIALLWARKGSAFRRGLVLDLRMVIKKSIWSASSSAQTDNHIHYFEREYSLDDSPAFSSSKKHRVASMRLPRMPCITAPSVVNFDNGEDWIYFRGENEKRTECIDSKEKEEERYLSDDEKLNCEVLEEVEDEERSIDLKAEEFIAKFYEQMKLQRQVSLLEYDEI